MKNLMGAQFGHWTVIATAEKAGKHPKWRCKCICGREKDVFETHLLSGNSRTCTNSGTHGIGKKTPGYGSWKSMLARCLLPNHIAYHRYGGRGIMVCGRWQSGFVAFYEDMGPRPDGMSLDRLDTDGNYEPANCRWATPKEQSNNTCTNVLIEDDGERLTIAELARKHGVNYNTLYSRLQRKGLAG